MSIILGDTTVLGCGCSYLVQREAQGVADGLQPLGSRGVKRSVRVLAHPTHFLLASMFPLFLLLKNVQRFLFRYIYIFF